MFQKFFKPKILIVLAILILVAFIAYYSNNKMENKKVLLETNAGNIVIELNPETPLTTSNFETLVSKGFYNGVLFHRVLSGFMIQGGDQTGTGSG